MVGIDRIKKLMENVKNNMAIKKIAEYLITRNDMDEKYQNENKDLDKMWKFIESAARKKAQNGCAVLEDQEVYNLAIHYFDEPDEALEKENKTESNTDKRTEKTEKEEKKSTDNTQKKEKPKHKDEDIVMIFKGKPITYKELASGQVSL